MRATPRIAARRFSGNYDISDVFLPPDSSSAPQGTRASILRPILQPPYRKGEHVGRSGFISKFTIHSRHGRIAHETDGDALFGESKLALHAFAKRGQRFHSQWYAALAI